MGLRAAVYFAGAGDGAGGLRRLASSGTSCGRPSMVGAVRRRRGIPVPSLRRHDPDQVAQGHRVAVGRRADSQPLSEAPLGGHTVRRCRAVVNRSVITLDRAARRRTGGRGSAAPPGRRGRPCSPGCGKPGTSRPSWFATRPTARKKPAISASGALATKSGRATYGPRGMTSTCVGAWGEIVMERDCPFVLVDAPGGDLVAQDAGEDVVRVVGTGAADGHWWLRLRGRVRAGRGPAFGSGQGYRGNAGVPSGGGQAMRGVAGAMGAAMVACVALAGCGPRSAEYYTSRPYSSAGAAVAPPLAAVAGPDGRAASPRHWNGAAHAGGRRRRRPRRKLESA